MKISEAHQSCANLGLTVEQLSDEQKAMALMNEVLESAKDMATDAKLIRAAGTMRRTSIWQRIKNWLRLKRVEKGARRIR